MTELERVHHRLELPPKLKKRLFQVIKVLGLSFSDAIQAAVHQYVCNQERFIQALRRTEHRNVNRQIYRYCSECKSKVNAVWMLKKVDRKTKKLRIGSFCNPCDQFLKPGEEIGIVEVRKLRARDLGYDSECPGCGEEYKNWKGVHVHQTKMNCYPPASTPKNHN